MSAAQILDGLIKALIAALTALITALTTLETSLPQPTPTPTPMPTPVPSPTPSPTPSPSPAPTPAPTVMPTPTPTPAPTPDPAKLKFFGGVTDPGLFPGEYPWSWPDVLFDSFIGNPYTEATAQDSCSEYQIQTGINEFAGVSGSEGGNGWMPLDEMLALQDQGIKYEVWYCGYEASINGVWPANIGITGSDVVTAWTNFLIAAAARYPKLAGVYLNYNNEGMLHNPGGAGDWAQAFGGPGSTGVDWIINMGKLVRQYFPKAKIGINDFNYESAGNDLPYGSPTQLPEALAKIKILKAAGVLDWVGMEGFSLESVSDANLKSALSQVGALGVKVIFTEFTPDGYQNGPVNLLADWQRLMGIIATDPNVEGVVGPWALRASSGIFEDGVLVDDTQSPPLVSPTMKFLQTFIPTVLQ